MQYRKLQADNLFDGYQFKQGQVLVIANNSLVHAIVPVEEAGEGVEILKGILTPGFINCHCHLELSHFKGLITPRQGMINFLLAVIKARKTIINNKNEAIVTAEEELYQNGVVGVADICNTTDAIDTKKISRLKWHSMVEVLNVKNDTLPERFPHFMNIKDEHDKQHLPAVLTPHAPYSVSPATFTAINKITSGAIISVHNQESPAEDSLFKNGTGNFLKFYSKIGYDTMPLPISGKSSLQTWLPYFTNGQTILLVHNTYIQEEDIVFAKEHAAVYGLNLVYCLCPNANLYVEDRLPPIDLLIRHDCHLVLGTDSYASNLQLSLVSEINTIRKYLPHLSFETLLCWATANGAKAMRWKDIGSFETGKQPGVNLLTMEKGNLEVTKII